MHKFKIRYILLLLLTLITTGINAQITHKGLSQVQGLYLRMYYQKSLDIVNRILDTTTNYKVKEQLIFYKYDSYFHLNIPIDLKDSIKEEIKAKHLSKQFQQEPIYYKLLSINYEKKLNYNKALRYGNLFIKYLLKRNPNAITLFDIGNLAILEYKRSLQSGKGDFQVGIKYIAKHSDKINGLGNKSYIACISNYYNSLLSLFFKINAHESRIVMDILANWKNEIDIYPECHIAYGFYYSSLLTIETYKSATHENINRQKLNYYQKKLAYHNNLSEIRFPNMQLYTKDKPIDITRDIDNLYKLNDHIRTSLNSSNPDTIISAIYGLKSIETFNSNYRFVLKHLELVNKNPNTPIEVIHFLSNLISLSQKAENKYNINPIVSHFSWALMQINTFHKNHPITINNYDNRFDFFQTINKQVDTLCDILKMHYEYKSIRKILASNSKLLSNVSLQYKTHNEQYMILALFDLIRNTNRLISFLPETKSNLSTMVNINTLQALADVIYTMDKMDISTITNIELDLKKLESIKSVYRTSLFDLYHSKINKEFNKIPQLFEGLAQRVFWKPSLIWSMRYSYSYWKFFSPRVFEKEKLENIQLSYIDMLLNLNNIQTFHTKRIKYESPKHFPKYIDHILNFKDTQLKNTYESPQLSPFLSGSIYWTLIDSSSKDECFLFPFYDGSVINLFSASRDGIYNLGYSEINNKIKNPGMDILDSDTQIYYTIKLLGKWFKRINIFPLDEVSNLLNYRAHYFRNLKIYNDSISIIRYRDFYSLYRNIINKSNTLNNPPIENAIFCGNFNYGVNEEFKFMNDDVLGSNKNILRSSNSNKTWTKLENTKQEITESAKYFKNSTIFQGSNINSKKLTSSTSYLDNYIFHIATHGFYSQGDAHPYLRSGLVLSMANERNDGYLTGKSVINWNLEKCQLFVLSACQSSIGDVSKSYSNSGILDAISIAGPRNIVASLWDIPDKETKEFFVLFYNHISAGLSVEKAFSLTEFKMSKIYPPYYWAAFCLYKN